MNLLAPVSTIMTKDLITISPNDPIEVISKIFGTKRIHHLPVIEDGQLVGIVSKSDYLFFRRGYSQETQMDDQRIKKHKASEIMIKGIAKLEPSDRINVALEIFKENILHAIPVVEDGKLRGIITPLDIIRHLADDKGANNEY